MLLRMEELFLELVEVRVVFHDHYVILDTLIVLA